MALRDPPRGVWLESWLVYEVDDLERETYRALLQLVGWLWVTKANGGPLRTTVAELGERWGIGERAVYKRLALFRERGYLAVDMDGGRVRVRLGDKQTPNIQTEQTPNMDTEQTPDTESHERRVHGERRVHENTESHERRVHEIGAGGVNNLGVGVGDLVFPESENQHHQTPPDAEVQAALLEWGVRPAAAMELAADPWVTLERVALWAGALARDRNVRSLAAVLYVNLREHWDPPAEDVQDGRRYIEGEFAEFVVH